MVDYTSPVVGGDTNTWGPKLNAVHAKFSDEIDAIKARLDNIEDNGSAVNPVVGSLTVGSITTTAAVITWTAPTALDGRGTPSTYRVGWGTWAANFALSASPLTLTGFTSGATYTVSVTPVFSDGTTGQSRSVQFTTTTNTPSTGDMPNGNSGSTFNGSNYYQASDHNDFSPVTTGALSWELWLYLSNVNQPEWEAQNYVHYFGKGVSGQHEWVARYYNHNTSDTGRGGSFSNYAYKLTGGQGAGANSRNTTGIDPADAGEWIHVAGTINTTGRIRIYVNGVLGSVSDLYSDSRYNVPSGDGNGTAPLRIGTRDEGSKLTGKMAKVAIYDREVAESEFDTHITLMRTGNSTAYDDAIEAETGLVAYWKLDPSSPTTDSSGNGHTLTHFES